MKWPVVCIFFFAGIIRMTCLWGQFYSTGEAPASIKWEKINSPHFSIVFPAGLAVDANKLANRLEFYMPMTTGDLANKGNKKFPILLNSTSVLSNGYVTLAPKRMELVVNPPQDSYAQDWITQLAVHEYRHVVQLNKLNQGFTTMLGGLTGEIGPGIVSSLIPSWFYEGDAVYNETRLTATGRGRIPGFEMPLRTILLENTRDYSYNKAVFGSYRNFVPDQYCYGFQMVRYARSRFGNQVWSQALDYTAQHPFLIWPLALYLKKNYGVFKSDLYKQTIDSLKEQYVKYKDTINCSDYTSFNKRKNNVFTSYTLPADRGDGSILTMRNGLNDPGSFVIIDSSGKVTVLFSIGMSMGLKNDLYKNILIWDEIVSDPRWARRDYSEIRIADLKTGKQRSLTRKTRYFSPDFSPDGQQIAVAENDEKNQHFITILDAHTGKQIRRISSPENREVQFPVWINASEIAAITVSDSGKQLEVCSLKSEIWKVKLPFTRFDIAEPLNFGNYLLFRSSFNKVENIFAVSKTAANLLYQVTFSRYGAYHPTVSIDSLHLLFSAYSLTGFDVVSIPLDTSHWKLMRQPPYLHALLDSTYLATASSMPVQDSVPILPYDAKPYRKSHHLLNLHSWIPFYTNWEDLNNSFADVSIYPGFMLYSQNLLSTVISSVGYRYNHGYHEFIPAIYWRAWYPVIELSGQLGGPPNALPLPEGITIPNNAAPYFEINLKTYIPLEYNRGSCITQIQPQVEYQQSGTWYYSGGDLRRGIDYLHFKLNGYHYSRLSQRDLYPKWGQFLTTTYTQTPVDKGQFGNLFSMQAVSFFPGIWANHHFYVKGGFQLQQPEKYYIPINRVDFPRGYNTTISGKFTSIMLNYSFTAGYPDLSIGPLLYLMRFRVNVFHDWSYGTEIREHTSSGVVSFSGNYRSYGTEILADMHLIRILFPLAAGVRLGYIPGEQKAFYELMLNLETGIF